MSNARYGLRVRNGLVRGVTEGLPFYVGLLDKYPGATLAYSLNKISSSYSGNCIKVRRSSDNAELNIGFTISGDLDVTSLLNFATVNNAFVTTWYDQSGNGNDLIQPTAASQPQIVSLGSIISDSGFPEIDSNQKFLYTTNTFNQAQPISTFAALKIKSTSNHNALYGYSSVVNFDIDRIVVTQRTSPNRLTMGSPGFSGNNFENNQILGTGINLNQQYLLSTIHNTPNFRFDVNSVSNSTTSSLNTLNGSTRYVMGRGWSSAYLPTPDIRIRMLVLYASDKSSDFNQIKQEINTFYNIYP